MKRYVYFKLRTKRYELRVQKAVMSLLLLSSYLLLLTSCAKRDEIDFKGEIIDTRECTLSYSRPDLGYLVELDTPLECGSDYTLQNGTTYHNVVILYDPDCILYLHDKIEGSFYLDDQYARANCSIHWNDIDNIPVGVFTSVSVD